MDVAAEVGLQRVLVLVAVRDYPGASEAFACGIDDQVQVVRSWWSDSTLGDRAFDAHLVPTLLTRRDVEDAVHVAGLRALSARDVAVVYVTGHGRRGASGRHYLLLPDTAHDRLLATGYPTSDLVTAVLDSHAEHVLVIIDSCSSGALIAELAQLRENFNPGRRDLTSLNVFTIGDFDEKPRVREFAELLTRLDKLWWKKAGYAGPFLTVSEFENELRKAAKDARLLQPHWAWRAGPSTTPSPCLPNPAYEQLDGVVAESRRQVADTVTELDYWMDRASGRVSADDPGWYFSGRRELTRAVANFLNKANGILLVTGAAGTGKSAMIARAVTLSDSGFRADPRYQQAVSAAPFGTVPPINSVDVAVLARNKDVDDIAAQLLTGLGVTPHIAAPGQDRVEVLREQLREHLLSDGRSRTLLLDGLDEARHPSLVIVELLGPLARLADDRRRRPVRLVVGVRSSAPGTSADNGGHELLDLLRRSVSPRELTELRTDGPDARTDIAAYVQALLADSPYAADARACEKIGNIVAERVAPSFLDARLAGRRLRDANSPALLDDNSWLRHLDEGTIGLLRSDLHDASTTPYPAVELLAVLRAAAFAQGAGTPWADIWPTVAAAVLDRPLPAADSVIAQVLGGRLSGYLARDVADGRVVYRPAHELLAQVLRRRPQLILGSTAMTPDLSGEESAVHRRITGRFTQLVSTDFGVGPHPYLRRHLVEHARRGGSLDDEHVTAGFLRWESSGRVRRALGLPVIADPRRAVLAAWAGIEPLLGDAGPRSRALSLTFAQLATGATSITEASDITPSLRSRWARWLLAGNVLSQVGSPVRAVATVPGPDGRTQLATGAEDGRVRLWDLKSGTPVGDPLIGHTHNVFALVTVPTRDGRTLLASGSWDGTVRLWDPTAGIPFGSPLTGHTAGVVAVTAVPSRDGRTLLASGSWDGTVRLWDPTAGIPFGSPLTGHTGAVTAVAAVPIPDGGTLLASGSSDGTIRLSEPTTGAPVGSPLTGHTGAVTALTTVPGPGGRILIASGTEDGTVRLWDPITSTSVGAPLTGHIYAVRGMAVVTALDGRTLLVTGAEDGTVRLWDPITGTPVGDPLTGHTGAVRGVTVVPGPDGGPLLATGSDDGTVRLWDLTTSGGNQLAGHPGWVTAVAAFVGHDRRTLLATVGYERTVRLWDVATGTPVGDPLKGHTSGIVAVAAVHGSDGRTLLATGAADGTVRLWDPITGTPVGDALTGHTGAVRAVAAVPAPGGRELLATGGEDGTLWLWDPTTGTPVGDPLKGHTSGIVAVAVVPAPDGRTLLASGSWDGTVRLWDPIAGIPFGSPLTGHTSGIFAVAAVLASDGRTLLASGSDDSTVRIWDPTTGTPVGDPLIGHTGSVRAVAAVSGLHRQRLLASGSDDGTVRIWDLDTGEEVVRLVSGAIVRAICADATDATVGSFLAFGGPAGVAVVEVDLPGGIKWSSRVSLSP